MLKDLIHHIKNKLNLLNKTKIWIKIFIIKMLETFSKINA